MAQKKETDFAAAIKRLEEIVEQLEGEDVSLEESTRLFEEGVKLAKLCSAKLSEAEKKIEQLSKDGLGNLSITPAEGLDEQ